ncbi:23S rRNA (uracil(1939)-C(5))-methyltransferase RlmD [Oceanisphaera pacifica]|uniref:23S rRNA (Uracil(1939)-C(5))-methyltransferase RlmD n=1 Tax=Oceanisphaera pacifica TaxID=2818389 RepID=A0ABS3NG14_9GAMM|nr:23S rRNA (uracil(1939)-C(5))-methyltransferase RlmD [Oceanisphaera pacifica]MBO1519318.1 23S rRNA (uracil(1939)-C(5))-methyltransferase RlmD [Oceanisphaera pacifica]
MVQFFKESKPKPQKQALLDVTVLDTNRQGMGVARYQGRPLLIAGALQGEHVRVRLAVQNNKYQSADLVKVLKPADTRLTPFCRYTHECGGCTLQHMASDEQRTFKANAVRRLFARQGIDKLPEFEWLEPIETQAYRRVARLAIRRQKKGVALGFRRGQSHQLVEIEHCGVLRPALSALIAPLRKLLNQLTALKQLGHLELYDAAEGVAVLLRHTNTLPASDIELLLRFAQQQEMALFLQDDNGRRPLHLPFSLYYQIDNIKLFFTPGDFIQINAELNAQMVSQAQTWLAAAPEMPILDLFCGVGNFSLPLASAGHPVIGVEGVMEMVEQARGNAEENNLAQARFYRADLAADFTQEVWAQQGFDYVLLDPGRAGAEKVMPYLCQMEPKRLLYVSCNPITLAQDSHVLLAAGYQLTRLSLIDMFPHTAHCEAMALFELS